MVKGGGGVPAVCIYLFLSFACNDSFSHFPPLTVPFSNGPTYTYPLLDMKNFSTRVKIITYIPKIGLVGQMVYTYSNRCVKYLNT